MKTYDPLKDPNSTEWLELDEQERVKLIADYHRRKRVDLPNRIVHAAFHAAVENQLAEGMPDVRDALSRLLRDGLDRHEAIHAIGSVLAECVWSTLKREVNGPDPSEVYLQHLRKFTADEWLKKVR
jgi:Domain of unknown function (DUF1841)